MTAEDTPELELSELLRRCHRDELLPLAAALGVNPHGLGLGDLARVCARTLRRQGDHALRNLALRGGEGPPYAQVLRGVARRVGIDATAQADVLALEQLLLATWAARAWKALSAPQRAALAGTLGEEPLPAEPPDITTLTVRGRVTELVPWETGAFVLGGGVLRVLLVLLGPLGGLLTLLWLGRPRDERLLPVVLEVARLRQIVRHRITVGVVGSPSSGKDAAIKAIFGVDSGNINPIAGSTREVDISRLPGATALYVVNTPGMGDVVESVTEEARQVLDHIDLFLYILNAQGGVQARELADYQRCRASGRPVLVAVNKIDTLRPQDRERYLTDARSKLQAPEDDFIPVAFDPLPQLSEHPIGLDTVRDWIRSHLVEYGKDPAELPWT